MRINNQCSHGP
jgi:hypothetical protein